MGPPCTRKDVLTCRAVVGYPELIVTSIFTSNPLGVVTQAYLVTIEIIKKINPFLSIIFCLL